MVNDFLKDIIKSTGNEYASLVEDGVEAGDVENFIDTGSYIFNALLSGSIQIKSPHLPARVLLVRRIFYVVSLRTFSMQILMLV